ncbi:MAG: hypothetical protein AAGJ50_04770, partial [Pseudomonadota bacterium]
YEHSGHGLSVDSNPHLRHFALFFAPGFGTHDSTVATAAMKEADEPQGQEVPNGRSNGEHGRAN